MVLQAKGFVMKSQRGSHVKLENAGRIVIVPQPKPEIPMGTFTSIIRQSGLTKADFH